MLNLQGKRVLFFTAAFLGYHNDIKESLERSGAQVDWFDERVSNGTLTKVLIRMNRNYMSVRIDAYYNKIIDATKDRNYDYIFFVNVEAASKKIIKKIKSYHSRAKFLLYEWDSIVNNKNAQSLLGEFDCVWSFDRNDCNNIGIKLLPLFYNRRYADLKDVSGNERYESLFVGTLHSDRYRLVKNIEKQVCKEFGKSFDWFYFPSKLLYYKMWATDSLFRKVVDKNDLRFSSLNKDELLDLVEKSKIIVDVQHPKQTGLTMRSIETLGARRKLITTNKDIVNYDFYNPSNILVVDRINPVVPEEFIKSPYESVPKEIFEKYSLESWLETIFLSV